MRSKTCKQVRALSIITLSVVVETERAEREVVQELLPQVQVQA